MYTDTLTKENLEAIKAAMLKIASNDRSDYFNNYLGEINWRLEYLRDIEEYKRSITEKND